MQTEIMSSGSWFEIRMSFELLKFSAAQSRKLVIGSEAGRVAESLLVEIIGDTRVAA